MSSRISFKAKIRAINKSSVVTIPKYLIEEKRLLVGKRYQFYADTEQLEQPLEKKETSLGPMTKEEQEKKAKELVGTISEDTEV